MEYNNLTGFVWNIKFLVKISRIEQHKLELYAHYIPVSAFQICPACSEFKMKVAVAVLGRGEDKGDGTNNNIIVHELGVNWNIAIQCGRLGFGSVQETTTHSEDIDSPEASLVPMNLLAEEENWVRKHQSKL